MEKVTLATITLIVVLMGVLCVNTNRRTLAKKLAVVFLILSVALLLTGCSMLMPRPKRSFGHRGYVCYTNATIIEVKNVREQLKFLGPAIKPEKKMTCDLVLRTDQNEILTAAQEGYLECSLENVNQRRTIYTFNDRIVRIDRAPDPYLEENSAKQ